MAAAIYTSCGRIGFPHATDSPRPTFFFSRRLSHSKELRVSYHVINRRRKPPCLSRPYMLLFYVAIFPVVAHHCRLRYNRVTVMESKPMHLLQFSHSIDSPSEIYVAFQWDLLLWPSLPPPQEGHGGTRVPGQMPSDSLRCTSTSKSHFHPVSLDIIDVNQNHRHRLLSCLHFCCCCSISDNSFCEDLSSKCSEK